MARAAKTLDGRIDPRRQRHAAVRRLALGRGISLTGSFAASTALTYSVFLQTRSTAWVAATMILTFGVIGFFAPIGGAIADRLDRRRVMIVSEGGAAVCWLLMAVLSPSLVELLALAFCASLLEAAFNPAASAAIPNLAGEGDLSRANSLLAIGRYAGLTVGPAIGGVLVAAVGAPTVFLVNAVSFVISVALIASVRGRFSEESERHELFEEYQGIGAGFRFIRNDQVLWWMLVAWVAFIIGSGTTIVADPVLARQFGWDAVGYGLISAVWGGGTIIGAWMARGIREDREARCIVIFSAVMALSALAVAVSPTFWLILFWVGIFGIADGPTQVVEQNLLQRRSPDIVRSRVMGAYDAVTNGAFVVALLIGGSMVRIVGPRGAYTFAGFAGLVGASLLTPLLRWLRHAPVSHSGTPDGDGEASDGTSATARSIVR